MKNMATETESSTFFAKADLVYAYYQMALQIDDTQGDNFVEWFRIPCISLTSITRFQRNGIPIQVRATELLAQSRDNILVFLYDWLLFTQAYKEYISLLAQFLHFCREYRFVLTPIDMI